MYGLLDCNNFFVSCERLFRPDLATRPTIVLSSNDGVAIARSQEVKELDIPMGAPYFKIRDLIEANNVAVFSGNHALYRDISKRVMSVLTEQVDEVFQYSVDEAFFRIDDMSSNEAKIKLTKIKQIIEKEVGVPVSIGAATTMTIAKYASEKEKRGSGVCVLRGEDWFNLTPEIPLREIWGIGGQTTEKMKGQGLNTVRDLLEADRSRIEKIFGVHGLRLISELSEQPAHSPEEREHFPLSIMSTRSFNHPVTALADLESAITRHVNEAATELRAVGGQALSIRIIIGTNRHGDWLLHGGSEEVTLSMATDDTRVFLKHALIATRKLFKAGVPYKKAGVVLGRLRPYGNEQLSMFETEVESSDSGLMKVLDSLNKKWGETVLSVGRVRQGGKFAATKYRSPEYTTLWSDLPLVRTKIKT